MLVKSFASYLKIDIPYNLNKFVYNIKMYKLFELVSLH